MSGRLFLYLAFFLSGVSGLVYQTLWVRMLTRYLGSTIYATSTVLGVFMAGLAIGGLLGGRLVDRVQRPARVYIILEIIIAVLGLLASAVGIAIFGSVYVGACRSLADQPGLLLAAKIGYAAICLLPPTILMGATLPVMADYVNRSTHRFQRDLGRLYSVNTFGAFLGVLATGFVLLGAIGETGTLIVAVVFNLLAAAAVLPYRRDEGIAPESQEGSMPTPYPPTQRRLALAVFFLSGFTALASEVLWTRLLTLYLETSIYAFSAMLAFFLVGVGGGSWLASRSKWAERFPYASFGILEVAIGFWGILSLLVFPWFDTPTSSGFDWALQVACCLVMVLPSAFCFGFQFPLAVRCCAGPNSRAGSLTGLAYFANAFGTIAGATTAGFLLMPLLGLKGALISVATLNLIAGALLLFKTPREESRPRFRIAYGVVGIALVVAIFLPDPYRTVIEQRLQTGSSEGYEIWEYRESRDATAIAVGIPDKPLERFLLLNGVSVTMLVSETKLMAHLPILLAEEPEDMLVICFGMGTCVGSASTHKDLRIDAVDIVSDVFETWPHFHEEAETLRQDPRLNLIADDGRNYLLVSEKRYDVITIDPSPPLHSAGTVNLYTKEFMTLCRDHLTDTGIMCYWVPTGPFSEVGMILRTFLELFPDATLWGGIEYPGFLAIGSRQPLDLSENRRQELVKQLAAIPDLSKWNPDYADPKALERTFLLDNEGLRQMVQRFPIIEDDRPYTEFPLWRVWLGDEFPPGDFTAQHVRDALDAAEQEKTPAP